MIRANYELHSKRMINNYNQRKIILSVKIRENDYHFLYQISKIMFYHLVTRDRSTQSESEYSHYCSLLQVFLLTFGLFFAIFHNP